MIEFVRALGEGSFGSVDLIKFTTSDGSNQSYYAVKSSLTEEYESLSKEFQILSELRDCPRIIKIFGTNLSRGVNGHGDKVYKMTMEYAASGTLASFMESNSLTDSMIRDFTRMILQGLDAVHSHGYVHCDLKPENLLVFPRHKHGVVLETSYELKLSDFGMSTEAGWVSEFWDYDSPFLGTPLYMSLESVQTGVAEKALDLWSLGCVVLEMYTGEPPWPFFESDELLPPLLAGNTPEIPQSVPSDAREFIMTCFASKPEERGSALELLEHPFLQKVSDLKTARVTGGEAKTVRVTGGEAKTVRVTGGEAKTVVYKPGELPIKPRKVKILPPKPLEFKKLSNKPLKVKFLPPKPPVFKKTSNKPLKVKFLPPKPLELKKTSN